MENVNSKVEKLKAATGSFMETNIKVLLKSGKEGGEEILLVQGKEQQLHFAGAAVKRYPTSKVRETQVRW